MSAKRNCGCVVHVCAWYTELKKTSFVMFFFHISFIVFVFCVHGVN